MAECHLQEADSTSALGPLPKPRSLVPSTVMLYIDKNDTWEILCPSAKTLFYFLHFFKNPHIEKYYGGANIVLYVVFLTRFRKDARSSLNICMNWFTK